MEASNHPIIVDDKHGISEDSLTKAKHYYDNCVPVEETTEFQEDMLANVENFEENHVLLLAIFDNDHCPYVGHSAVVALTVGDYRKFCQGFNFGQLVSSPRYAAQLAAKKIEPQLSFSATAYHISGNSKPNKEYSLTKHTIQGAELLTSARVFFVEETKLRPETLDVLAAMVCFSQNAFYTEEVSNCLAFVRHFLFPVSKFEHDRDLSDILCFFNSLTIYQDHLDELVFTEMKPEVVKRQPNSDHYLEETSGWNNIVIIIIMVTLVTIISFIIVDIN